MAQAVIDVADKAFAAGMADAMLIAAVVMGIASIFTLLVLPSDIRCIEVECEEEEVFEVGKPEMVPAPGD